MREGFELLNLHPLTFDPELLDVGATLVGHVFGVEIGEHRGQEAMLFAVKAMEPTKAVDTLSRKVVDVAANLAIRVVALPSLMRIRGYLPQVPAGFDGGEPNDVFPCMLFRVVQFGDGPKTLIVFRNRQIDTTRGAFAMPSAAPPLQLDAIAAAATAATPAPETPPPVAAPPA
jgi:hypothetical protein